MPTRDHTESLLEFAGVDVLRAADRVTVRPGLGSRDGVEIGGADATAVSFPGFFDIVGALAGR